MTKINDTRGSKGFPNSIDYNPLFKPVDLKIRELNSLIYSQGIRVLIHDIIPCPNVKSIDGNEHEINCTICNGKGYVDVNQRETLAFSQSYSKDLLKNQENIITEWEDGVAYFTFLPGINLSYFSKIIIKDIVKPFYERIQRQEGDADKAHYSIFSINYLMDETGKTYSQNTDFIVENGMIKWIPNKAPLKGTKYSINYHTSIVYRCMSALHHGRYGTNSEKTTEYQVVEYPEQWKVKLDYLVTQTKSNGEIIEQNKVIDPKDIQDLFPNGE